MNKGILLQLLILIGSLCFSFGQPLQLEKVGTDQVYFSYQGKPLLSFGGMSDFIFYAAEDAFDYKKWADWQKAHGMNHCRAYLPGSWTYVEKFTKENGGSVDNVLFPFQETEPEVDNLISPNLMNGIGSALGNNVNIWSPRA